MTQITLPSIDLTDALICKLLGNTEGWLFLGYKKQERAGGKNETIIHESFRWPEQQDDAIQWIEDMAPNHSLYWCPLLRTEDRRTKGNAVRRNLLWLDLDGNAGDEALVEELRPLIINSGRPGHQHLYVPLRDNLGDEEWHAQARGLRDAVGGGADAKIADNDFMRLPGSINFRTTPPTVVTKVPGKPERWKAPALSTLVRPARTSPRERASDRVTRPERVSQGDLPASVRAVLRRHAHVQAGDRSEAFFAIVRECHKAKINGKPMTIAQTAGVLQGHKAAERFEAQRRLLEQVEKIWHEDGAVSSAERRIHLTPASAIKPKRLKWLWNDRIPDSALCIIAGREDTGKSTVCIDLAARVTRGELEGEHDGHPQSVIYVANEDSWSHTLRPRLEAAEADLDKVFRVDVTDAGDDGWISLPTDVDGLADAIQTYGVGLVVLDPILSVLDNQVDDSKVRELRLALEPINRLAEDASCAILGIAHFNKRASSDIGMLISGNLAWSQVARATLAMVKDPNNPDGFILSNGKNNLAPKSTPSLAGQLVERWVETDDGPTRTSRVEWVGESEIHVSEVLEGVKVTESINASDAWLASFLTEHGSTPKDKVLEAAEDEGFSERTLQRALKRIGGRSKSSGYSGDKVATWSLPSESVPTESESDSRAYVRDS